LPVFFISGYLQAIYESEKVIEIYPLIYIIIYTIIYIMRCDMAKVLLSIPDEELEKIDDYRKKKGLKRNKFFMDAVKSYFLMEEKDRYFVQKKNAVKSMMEIRKKLVGKVSEDWDPVKEIRKARDERANELLKRWEGE